MARIQVLYFATLREQAGREPEMVQTAAGTASALWDELSTRHGLQVERRNLVVAINEALVPWTTPLQDGDTVVFLPPVSGG